MDGENNTHDGEKDTYRVSRATPRTLRRALAWTSALWLLVAALFAVAPQQAVAEDTVLEASFGADAAGGSVSISRLPWRWPTGRPAVVLRAFDPPAMPWLSGHRGVDLRAPEGSQVLAPAPGQVIFAGMVAGRPVVSVMHSGGLRSTYEPVSPALEAGAFVSAGDVLGTLEAGHDGGALHWGARYEKNQYIDPLRLLSGPSVLKPWP